jgi:hypothetical protein
LVTTALFDVRWNSRFGAALNLFRSLFVIVALGCGAVLFNNDSNRLVLRPIERMLRKVCSKKAFWTLFCSRCVYADILCCDVSAKSAMQIILSSSSFLT